MTRGRKARVATVTLPPKDHFTSHLAPLLATREHLVSPSAAHLWAVLRAHAWRDGRCDLSDLELSAWMGGLALRHVYNLRTELAEAGLMAISRAEDGVRWLTPLPPEEGECSDSGNLFHRKCISPEIHFSGNDPVKEEEVNNINIPPPPPLPPPPPGDFTGNELPPHAALARFLVGHGAFPGVAGELAGVLLARMSRGEAEVYSLALLRAAEDSGDARSGRIDAERVTGRWIARMRSGVRPPAWAVAEARETIASARQEELAGAGASAADGSTGFAGGEGWDVGPGESGEQEEGVGAEIPNVTGSGGVLRLRSLRSLRSGCSVTAGFGTAGGDGRPGDEADAAGEVGEVAEAEEAEERPWIVNGGRACSHRELWDLALSHLRLQLPAGTFDEWLRGTTCDGTDASGRMLVVQVRDRNAVDWLTVRLRRMVLRTLEGITGLGDLDVRFEEG